MKHLGLMILFAALVAVVFGAIGREGLNNQFRYGLKIFAEFVGVGFVLAWILYWVP